MLIEARAMGQDAVFLQNASIRVWIPGRCPGLACGARFGPLGWNGPLGRWYGTPVVWNACGSIIGLQPTQIEENAPEMVEEFFVQFVSIDPALLP